MHTSLRGAVRALTVTAVAAASVLMFVATPASAKPPTAFERCHAAAAPNQVHNISIIGDVSSVTVGAPDAFWAGDVFRLRASGTIHTSALVWDNYTPDGRAGDFAPLGDPAWPGPGLKKFSLVGSLGPGAANLQLGTYVYCVVVPSNWPATYLKMCINDNMTNDNSGRWDITIDHYWA